MNREEMLAKIVETEDELEAMRLERNAYRRLATFYVRALMDNTDFPTTEDMDSEVQSAFKAILRAERGNQAKRERRAAS